MSTPNEEDDREQMAPFQDPKQVAIMIQESVNSSYNVLIKQNQSSQALQNTIALAMRGLGFTNSLGVLLESVPNTEGVDDFIEIYELLLTLDKDISEAKLNLQKEFESC